MDSRNKNKKNKPSIKTSTEIIATKNLSYSSGIDSYVNKGNLVNTLTLEANERKSYFAARPQIKALLLREKINPILEEGDFTPLERDHEGEYYLTYEALTLLIEKKIRQHKPKNNSFSYNAKNIYVIKNSLENLENILKNLNLQADEDAKIIYIHGIHAIPFYIRRENNTIKCFIVDSEADAFDWPEEVIASIQEAFPAVNVFLSSTRLQKDYYSCATFAFKTLLYFVKHGAEVFPYLEKINCYYDSEIGCQILPADKLIPALLKMCQTELLLSDETLDSIVSHKKNISLRQYLANNKIKVANKIFNSAAIIKKYLYLHEINQNMLHHRIEAIDPNGDVPLPKALQSRHNIYSRSKLQTGKKSYRLIHYTELLEYCDNPELTTETANITSFKLYISNKFPGFWRHYQTTFKSGITNDTSPELVKLQKLLCVAAYLESEYLHDVSIYFTFAEKLFRLFSTYDKACQYLTLHLAINNKQPIHDACLFELPKQNESWNRKYWADLTIKYGLGVTSYLPLAPSIEICWATFSTEEKNKLSHLTELDQIKQIALTFSYKDADRNRALALLCLTHQRTEEDFEQCLLLIENKLKKFDFLPAFEIKGCDIEPGLVKFRFVKLPIKDLRGLFLGEYTACCQSMAKAGESCAIYGMVSVYGGFYVVYDHYNRIIAQSFAWIGKNGEFVFDSWEYANKNQKYICEPFLETAANIIQEYGFTRVLIGAGGNTPREIFSATQSPAEQIYPVGYSDAHSQLLINDKPALSLAERFCIYAKRTDLNFEKYSHFFNNDKVNLDELLKSIASKQLSATDFIKIYQFQLFSSKITFPQSFIETILETYGKEVSIVYFSQTSEGISWLEHFIKTDEIKYLLNILNILDMSYEIKFNRLIHIAVKFDAINVFEYLYQHFYQDMSQDEYFNLKSENGSSVFFNAVQYNSTHCIHFVVDHIQDKNIVTTMLQQQDSHGKTILHYLAQNNQLALIQKICSFYSNDPKIYDLMAQHGKITYDSLITFSGPVILSALFSKSYLVKDFIFTNFYQNPGMSLILDFNAISKWETVLYKVIINNDVLTLAVLRQLYVNENDWHKSLKQRHVYGTESTLFHEAFPWCAINSILFILQSYQNYALLDELISLGRPELKHIRLPNDMNKIVREFLRIYANQTEKIAAIFLTQYFPIFNRIINTENLAIFSELLQFLSKDQKIFNKCIQKNEHHENFLNYLVTQLTFCNTLSEHCQIQFLACFLNLCTTGQLKLLFQSYDFILNGNAVCLKYLLIKIDQIDNGCFAQEIFLTPENVRKFLRASFHNRKSSSDATEIVIDYYTKHHIAINVSDVIRDKNLSNPITNFGNFYLLKYAFTSICQKPTLLNQIFADLVACHRFHCLDMLSWLLDQNVISNEILTSTLTFAITYDCYKQVNLHWPHSETQKLLWQACEKKMHIDDLYQFIRANFSKTILNIIFVSQYNSHFFWNKPNFINSGIMLLHHWLSFCKNNQLDYYALISAKSPNHSYTLHNIYQAQNLHLIKLLFLHCNSAERAELINDYMLSNLCQSEFLIKLMNIAKQFELLDEIRFMQSNIGSLSVNTCTSLSLFNQRLLPKNVLEVTQIFYTKSRREDEYDSELIIISEEEIQTIYNAYCKAFKVPSLTHLIPSHGQHHIVKSLNTS